jgi:hypothetical protein
VLAYTDGIDMIGRSASAVKEVFINLVEASNDKQ